MLQQAVESKNKGTKNQPGRLCSSESPSGGSFIKDFNYDESIDRLNRMMAWYSMTQLLEPKHKYFKDMWARVKEIKIYKQKEHKCWLGYPSLCGINGNPLNKKNPYRKYQLARSHTARTINMIIDMIKKFALSAFKCAFLTLTMPKEVSLWLSYQKNGRDIAWRLYQKFWDWYSGRFGPELACRANLHTWESSLPIEPHYHIHSLIPNYKKIKSELKDEENEDTYNFKMVEWHQQRGGKHVPHSENEMNEIKLEWWKIIVPFCKRHNIKWWGTESEKCAEKMDIHWAYASWFQILSRTKLMHWFNYQGRNPLEDYVRYSNEHLDCPDPPKWLVEYENQSRAFGWWKIMKKMCPVGKREKVKINPVTGERMECLGKISIYQAINEGRLGFLEVIKGNPVFHKLRPKEILWLASIDAKAEVDKYGTINLARQVYG